MRAELMVFGVAKAPAARSGLSGVPWVERAVTLAVALWFAVSLAGLVVEGQVPPPVTPVQLVQAGETLTQSPVPALAGPGRLAIAV